MSILRAWAKEAWEVLLPESCTLCHRSGVSFELPFLCRDCMLHLFHPQRIPFPELEGFPFSAFSLGPYQAGLRKLIHRAKFTAHLPSYEVLLQLCRASLWQIPQQAEAVTSIPCHFWRNWQRGTHLPGLMGRHVSKLCQLPYDPSLIRRTRRIAHQTGLERNARIKNMTGAFRAMDRAEKLSVLVVDDVCTSGTTATQAARAFFESGAANVTFLFLANVTKT